MIIDPDHINRCPGTLKQGFASYSTGCLNRMFDRRKVSHLLPFLPPQLDESVAEKFRQNRARLSISGVQTKLSLVLKKNKLVLTPEGERGEYILKPVPIEEDYQRLAEVPANEHLTMQIAAQVFGIETAANCLVFFQNGEPAYLTRRFDLGHDQSRIPQEDFASLMGRSKGTHGPSFKYEGSYEEMAKAMRQFLPAYQVEIMKFFELVLFNFVFGNGDAHLKNFSVRQTPQGDYILSPAYDLLNTALHIPKGHDYALEEGLYEDFYLSDTYGQLGFTCYDDFIDFGQKVNLPDRHARKILSKYQKIQPTVESLIHLSFLDKEARLAYLDVYRDRVKALNISMRERG